jgi:hypothetical protein
MLFILTQQLRRFPTQLFIIIIIIVVFVFFFFFFFFFFFMDYVMFGVLRPLEEFVGPSILTAGAQYFFVLSVCLLKFP